MNKRQFLLVIAMTFLGGIIGGTLSNYFLNNLAYSKDEVKFPVKDTIDAKLFRVIDDKGAIVCTLGFKSNIPSLEFFDGEWTSKMDSLGLESNLQHKDVGLVRTRINPSGFYYYYYSKWEMKARGNNPLLELSFEDDSLIRIGGDHKSPPSIAIRDKKTGTRGVRDRTVLGTVELRGKNEERIIRPPSSLIFFNENGKVIFEAP